MRKEFIILAAIAMITVSAAAVVAVANLSDDPGNSQQIKVLTHDLAAQSRITAFGADEEALMQLHYIEKPPDEYRYLEMPFDVDLNRRLDLGHVVHFTYSRPFIVDEIVINATYDNESGFVPFAVELWDDKGGLLYKITDISAAYFSTEPWSTRIEIPATNTDGDFFIVFYPRSSVAVGAHIGALDNRSFMAARGLGMIPAVTLEGNPFEWAISVVGRDA